VLRAESVEKSYVLGRVRVDALRGVDLAVGKGEFVVVVGPSGSGKSTLLNLLGVLDRPDVGRVHFEEVDVAAMTEGERTRLRRRRLGFVFQSFNLVPVLSAYENVEYPLWLDGGADPADHRLQRSDGHADGGPGFHAGHLDERLLDPTDGDWHRGCIRRDRLDLGRARPNPPGPRGDGLGRSDHGDWHA
jgi:putative ABC transport system ATP-binding protein